MAQASSPSDDWRRIVQAWYPDLLTKTHCVPPLIFNRVPYERKYINGQPVLMACLPADAGCDNSQTVEGDRAVGAAAGATSSRPDPQHTKKSKGAGVEPHQSPTDRQHSMWTRESGSAKPSKVQKGDVRDDFAQQHVLHCLQKLGDKQQEVMFVLSELGYGDYLRKPLFAKIAANFPRPIDKQLPSELRQGDFDVLVVHRKYGILIGEVKAVGMEFDYQSTQADWPFAAVVKTVRNENLAKTVKSAVKQLEKGERIVKHLVQDIHPDLSVRKTIVLPYVSSQQLLEVLDKDQQVAESVCRGLGARDKSEAVELCLCADQLSDRATPWHVPDPVLSKLQDWFQRRMSCSVDPLMTDDVYLDILASVHCVVPPRVEVRTAGEAVSELGERLARLVLTPRQLDLLQRKPDMMCLVGPPGTGKTIVLVMIGLHWLQQGHDVHVVVGDPSSYSVSLLVHHQLEMTLRELAQKSDRLGKVHFHFLGLIETAQHVEKVVNLMRDSGARDDLHILMDEAYFSTRVPSYRPYHAELVTELLTRVPRLYFWTVATSTENVPQAMQVEVLAEPLRSAPVIVREVKPTFGMEGVPTYSSSGTPSPSDGPNVIRLRHEGQNHVREWPVECFQCGTEVARVLTKLGVGAANAHRTTDNTSCPPSLMYRDVFVITQSDELKDETLDDEGHVTSSACGFVLGLRSAGVPTAIALPGAKRDTVLDMAIAGADHVRVCNLGTVVGLERKVVVCLQGRALSAEKQTPGISSPDKASLADRQTAVSRCTTQLVMVETPQISQWDEYAMQ